MSCSRRDFFSSLLAACFAMLGLRARATTAAAAALPPSSLPLCEPLEILSTVAYTYDGGSSLISTTHACPNGSTLTKYTYYGKGWMTGSQDGKPA